VLVYFILFIAGIFAGFVNTLAGGGSIIVLPILIFAGLSSPVANATNRIAILFQNITGTYRFHKHKMLEIKPIKHIAVAVVLGAIAGSLMMSKISSNVFDIILGVILIIVVIFMLKPHKERNRFTSQLPKWLEFLIFLGVGFYGGFIQVGVGFIMLGTLNIIEEFNLVKANAVKLFLVLCYTVFAVVIFSLSGKIVWKYGLVLALGNIIGAYVGVKTAVERGAGFVKIVLVIMVILASLKLFGIIDLSF